MPTYLLLTLYPLLPGEGLLYSGVPLGPAGLIACFAMASLAWLARRGGAPDPGRRLLMVAAGLCAARCLMGAAQVQQGLVARYHANSDLAGPCERSLRFPGLPATRIDRSLEFAGEQFPLYFLNDTSRFKVDRARQAQLPFSVRWEGYLRVPASRGAVLLAESPNPVQVRLAGRTVLDLAAGAGRGAARVELSQGLHPIAVIYRNPAGAPRLLRVGFLGGGGLLPLGAGDLFAAPHPRAALQRDRWARGLLGGVDGGHLLLVLGLLLRAGRGPSRRALLPPGVLLAGLAAGLLRWRALRGALVLLGGGDDWSIYETLARDIALNGPLMLQGAAPGHAAPFYFQVLYPYFLAGCHLLLGEDLYGAFVLQTAFLAAAGVLLGATARQLWGPRAGAVTLALWLCAAWTGHVQISGLLLSENLALLLFPLCGLLLVRALACPTPGGLCWAGLVFGLSVLTRATLLPALPALLWLIDDPAGRRRGPGRPARLLIPFLIGALAPLVLVGLRNHLAAGVLAWLPVSGPVNLLLGNRPPPGLAFSPELQRPLYQALGLAGETRLVLEYARQAPGAFAQGLLGKLLYSLGFLFLFYKSGLFVPISLVFIACWAGTGRALWSGRACLPRGGAALLALAGAQLLCLVILSPCLSYRHRLLLPLYLSLYPFAGHELGRLLRCPARR